MAAYGVVLLRVDASINSANRERGSPRRLLARWMLRAPSYTFRSLEGTTCLTISVQLLSYFSTYAYCTEIRSSTGSSFLLTNTWYSWYFCSGRSAELVDQFPLVDGLNVDSLC